MRTEKKITASLLVVYLIVLSWIILFKLQFSLSELGHIRSINLIPFNESVIINGKIDIDEIINNALVFIPVGAYLHMLMPDTAFLKKIGIVFGISLAFEVLQFIFAIGASDVTDLITNTAGGVIGIAIVYLVSVALKDKTHKILNRIALVCTVLVAAFLFVLLAVNNLF